MFILSWWRKQNGIRKRRDYKCDILYSVKYQLLVQESNRLVSPGQNNASTQTLYQNIHLRRLIQQYALTFFRRAQREGRSSMSSFKLLEGVLYYWISITCNFEYNCSPSFLSVVEKSKQNFPVIHIPINRPSIKDLPTLDECRQTYRSKLCVYIIDILSDKYKNIGSLWCLSLDEITGNGDECQNGGEIFIDFAHGKFFFLSMIIVLKIIQMLFKSFK